MNLDPSTLPPKSSSSEVVIDSVKVPMRGRVVFRLKVQIPIKTEQGPLRFAFIDRLQSSLIP